MIIVNADDWGRSRAETESARDCFEKGRITSVSAMVFMEDSSRAADLAIDLEIDVGLHLNLTQPFSKNGHFDLLREYHNQIVRFLTINRYALLFYHPMLRKQFQYTFQAQLEEFIRLYKKPPSHINGHHHMHLCTNILFDRIIPDNVKVRRNFSFWSGEKNTINRMYRRIVDRFLSGRHSITDYFFSLSQVLQNKSLTRVYELSKTATVEIMAHPSNEMEYTYLMSNEYLTILSKLDRGTYTSM